MGGRLGCLRNSCSVRTPILLRSLVSIPARVYFPQADLVSRSLRHPTASRPRNMAASAAIPGLFLVFAAMVLLVFVCLVQM